MSASEDLRLKVSVETHCALVSHARAHGCEKFDVAREILDKWAVNQIHGASMLGSCLRAKGAIRAAEGIAGAAQGIVGPAGASLEWE